MLTSSLLNSDIGLPFIFTSAPFISMVSFVLTSVLGLMMITSSLWSLLRELEDEDTLFSTLFSSWANAPVDRSASMAREQPEFSKYCFIPLLFLNDKIGLRFFSYFKYRRILIKYENFRKSYTSGRIYKGTVLFFLKNSCWLYCPISIPVMILCFAWQ